MDFFSPPVQKALKCLIFLRNQSVQEQAVLFRLALQRSAQSFAPSIPGRAWLTFFHAPAYPKTKDQTAHEEDGSRNIHQRQMLLQNSNVLFLQ